MSGSENEKLVEKVLEATRRIAREEAVKYKDAFLRAYRARDGAGLRRVITGLFSKVDSRLYKEVLTDVPTIVALQRRAGVDITPEQAQEILDNYDNEKHTAAVMDETFALLARAAATQASYEELLAAAPSGSVILALEVLRVLLEINNLSWREVLPLLALAAASGSG
uniref:serine hydrolase n=1 Tax=synthetic construct TaxID=32630 RepID=UPI0039FDE188